jgi:hypothetical protein
MARLAEIKQVVSAAGQQPKTVYVNPLNVLAIEPVPGGTRIVLNGGLSYQTSLNLNDVLAFIQSAML